MLGSPANSSYVGLTLADRYRLDDRLAKGTLSQVFRGQDAVLRRGVVVKVVPPTQVFAFQAALHATAALTHPAIVAVFDAVEHEGSLFVVQEYVQSRPFPDYLRVGLPVERATDLASQIARALAYAHSRGVVHGDLTPAAVLVDRRAVLRLNNFALPPDTAYFDAFAHALESPDTTRIAAAEEPTPYAEDVRAVGLILWQALSTPHPAGTPTESAEDTDRAFRADVPERARALVRRCLLRAHPNRIRDAETLVLEFEALARELARLRSPLPEVTPPALRVARQMVQREAPWSLQETLGASQPWATSDQALAQANSGSFGEPTAPGAFAASGGYPEQQRAPERDPRFPPHFSLPSRPLPALAADGIAPRAAPATLTHAGEPASGPTLSVALLLGAALFIVCFLIGFFILH